MDTADFAGLPLVLHASDRGPGNPMFFGGRFDSEFGGGSEAIATSILEAGNDLVVPAGNYLLYLLPDEEPLTVTLRPRGDGLDPEGHVELSPRRPTQYEVRSLTPRVTIEGERQIYSAGDASWSVRC